MTGAGRGHRVVEHTADQAIEAWGPTRGACLEEVARGVVALFADVAGTSPSWDHNVEIAAPDDRLLLLDVLDEIVYLADARDVVPVEIAVTDDGDTVRVSYALAAVGEVDTTGPAIKGVSLSGLTLADEDGVWWARAVLDI